MPQRQTPAAAERRVQNSSTGGQPRLQYLAQADKKGEDKGAHSHTKHAVKKVASEHRKDDIGPGVDGVEESIFSDRDTHHLEVTGRGEGERGEAKGRGEK